MRIPTKAEGDVDSIFPITVTFDRKTVAKIKRSTFLARVALRFWVLARILHGVGNRLKVPRQMAEAHLMNAKYARLANVIPDDPADTGYTGDYEITTFFNYRKQLTDEYWLNHSESKELYKKLTYGMSDLIKSKGNIKTVFNFGVSYAYVDSILAQDFQNIQFWGYDRSSFTKAVNEVEFAKIRNLKFLCGDLFEHITENAYVNGIFLHCRTACVLNKPILEEVYDKAFHAGFEYVAAFEQFGLSRETFGPFTFSLQQTDSVPYRNFMFIHNYPALLLNAGYRVEKFEIFKTDSPHPDYKMAAFVAVRDPSLRQTA